MPQSVRRGAARKGATLASILLAATLWSQTETAAYAAPNSSRPAAAATTSNYVLGDDDVLGITVSNHPNLNDTVIVRPDGKITLPRVGEIVARGKTTQTLAREIEQRLARTLNNARVQIVVKEANSRKARIIGAVKETGTYPLKAGWRVLDLVAAAGGLTTKTTRIEGRIVRGGKVIPFNIGQAVSRPTAADNVPLQPGDVVELAARDYTRGITVAGSIGSPGAYDFEENLTVTALLAQAGGTTSSAALRNAYVLRDGEQIPLDLTGVTGGTPNPDSPAAKFAFQLGDVLMVPENTARYGVMGHVANPSYYPLPENAANATVLKALALAGGATPDADLSAVTLTRTQGKSTEVLTVNAQAMLEGTTPDATRLQTGDVLFVPKKDAQVHIIGQVQKPGAYPLQDGMTLISLLAAAGNTSRGAGLSRAHVLRDGVQIPLNLRPVLIEGKTDNAVAGFRLQRNDVLVIPDISDQIHVIGQVQKPGAYNLEDNLNVVSLLAGVGNTTERAALSQTYVLRNGARLPLDLHALLISNTADESVANFQFQPGDVLVVPENQARYAVMGQVARPGSFIYPDSPENATVLKALSAAGGALPGDGGGNLKQASIVRVVDGNPTQIPVNLEALFKNKKGEVVENVVLQPEDVLYIPPKNKPFRITDIFSFLAPLQILGLGF